MQRRAAAMYFAFFVIVGAAAYGLIATTSAPAVSMDGDARTAGDEVTLNDRSFTVGEIEASDGGGAGSSSELTWRNESAVTTETLANGSDVPPTDVVWEDQQARSETTIEDGSTIASGEGEYSVSVNGSASELTLTNVENESVNETFGVGDSFDYEGNEATVTAVGDGSATIVWGDPYLVDVRNESVSDPTEADLIQQRNVTALATQDPALYDETFSQNGVQKVTYRENDTNVNVTEYFGEVETHTVEEGGTLDYQGNETTVESITNTSVELAWEGERTESLDIEEGGNFTVDGEQYFAHFPDGESVQILSTEDSYGEYHSQNQEISSYESRMLGLWGIAELSALAAIILLATAYLPVRG